MRVIQVRTVPVCYRYPERPPMSGGGVNATHNALLVFLDTTHQRRRGSWQRGQALGADRTDSPDAPVRS